MVNKIKAAVIGASGYTGLELIKILGRHNNAEPVFLTSRSNAGKKVGEVFPASSIMKSIRDIKFSESMGKDDFLKTDILFLCLPPGQSMLFLKENLKYYKGKIVDLGADFRLDDHLVYEETYKSSHVLKDILPEFTYGLCEINRKEIKKSDYVANPGCYPTSVILALAPLLKNSKLKISSIVIDSKSGVSGAGKKVSQDYIFLNIADNFKSYSPVFHRHIPEMEQELSKIKGESLKIVFTPHLLPIARGIFSTIYLNIENNINDIEKEIEENYKNFFKNEKFAVFTSKLIPEIKDVAGSNAIHVGYAYDKRASTLKIFSVIDNILKGASGQAVQNMNIMFGFNEDEGLNVYGINN